MALKGTLRDFGIGEILHLIGLQSKTGTLTLNRRGQTVRLHFQSGAVVGIETRGADRGPTRLGAMLLVSGLVDEPTLRDAEARARKEGRPLGSVLHESGSVPPAELFEVAALETREALYDLLSWESGSYVFEPGEVETEHAAQQPISVESLLLEGLRRTDEWPMIRKRISSYETTYVPGNPASTGAPPDEHSRRVLEIARPGVTVWEIIARSRLGEFETCHALLTLLETGRLRASERPKGGPKRTASLTARRGGLFPGATRRSWGQSILATLGQALLGMLAVAAVFVILRYAELDVSVALRASPDGRIPRIDPRGLLATAQIERLRSALEVYRLDRGEYPTDLRMLVAAGLLADGDLRFPFESSYPYRRLEPTRYELVRPLF